MKYAIYNSTSGKIRCTGNCPDGYEHESVEPGENWVAIGAEVSDISHYVSVNDQVSTLMPERPSVHHVFDYFNKSWQDPRSLPDFKTAKWSEIKQAREDAMSAPLSTPYGIFDADEGAQANIIKTVLLANNLTALAQPVAIDYTLFDNSVATLDAPMVVNVGLMLAAREQAVRDKATALRAQIEAALTQQDIDAIAW